MTRQLWKFVSSWTHIVKFPDAWANAVIDVGWLTNQISVPASHGETLSYFYQSQSQQYGKPKKSPPPPPPPKKNKKKTPPNELLSDVNSCACSPVADGEVGWFNHCMVYFLSSLPLLLILLLVTSPLHFDKFNVPFISQVLPWCLASTLESCHQRRASQKTKQSQVFVFTVWTSQSVKSLIDEKTWKDNDLTAKP